MMLPSSLALALAATAVRALPSLELQGSSFVNPETGNKFQIVGVAYQPGGESGYKPDQGIDALSDGEICRRDAAVMQRLGINAIRTYNLSPDINHDECASVFDAAGMYMLLDVNSPLPQESLHREQPWTTYEPYYLNRTFAVVEAFRHYPNTLLFFSANEVIDAPGTAEVVPPYLRAVQRDLRQYIDRHSDRPIPVGYSAADVREVLADTYNYLVCDNGDDSAAQIFALNSYSWCGPETNYDTSTYADLVADFADTSVPVFFSEYGCNVPQPRYFNETQSIYGVNMTGIFSGGLVYEYSQEDNNYGIVDIENDGTVRLRPDFARLRDQFLKIDFDALQDQQPESSGGDRPTCSSNLIREADFEDDFDIPELIEGARSILSGGVDPKPSGSIVDIDDWSFSYKIYDGDAEDALDWTVVPREEANTPGSVDGSTGGDGSGDDDDAAVFARPHLALTLALPAVGAFFAFAL